MSSKRISSLVLNLDDDLDNGSNKNTHLVTLPVAIVTTNTFSCANSSDATQAIPLSKQNTTRNRNETFNSFSSPSMHQLGEAIVRSYLVFVTHSKTIMERLSLIQGVLSF